MCHIFFAFAIMFVSLSFILYHAKLHVTTSIKEFDDDNDDDDVVDDDDDDVA